MVFYAGKWSAETNARFRATQRVVVLALLISLKSAASAQTVVTVAWNALNDPAVVGYRVYQGTNSRAYTKATTVVNANQAQLPVLDGTITFFALTACNANGFESDFSAETSFVSGTNSAAAPIVILTAPSDGSVFTAPADIPLVASVVPNGHTIGKMQFLNGTQLIGEDTTAPFNFIWSGVSPGAYGLRARLSYDGTASVESLPVGVTVSSPRPPATSELPLPWQTIVIGPERIATGASATGEVFTVSGAGLMAGTADNFQFVHQPLSGDGEIITRLTSIAPSSNPKAYAGLMIRESLTPSSRYTFIGMAPNGSFRWQRRGSTAGGTTTKTAGSGIFPNSWVRPVRRGRTFYGYRSADGLNWRLLASPSIVMATNIYFGFAVASGSTNAPSTARFDNVRVVP